MAEKTNITRDVPPEAIEQDIARTRQEMSGTVDAIQEKLSPGHIKSEAREKLRASTVDRVKGAASRVGRTARDTGSTIADVVKSNPVPLAMIGAGIAWLVLNRTRGDVISETASNVASRAGDLSGQAQARAGELAGQVREAGSEFAGRATQSAWRMRRAARERAQAAGGRLQDTIQDNPLSMLLAAFGIGALIGFLIPETRREQQLMGSASDALLSRAKETAQRAMHRAQHAAERAVQSAEEDFKKTA